ncbi:MULTISPECIES: hypothetical protein [Streptomyces]|uniref:hypothetical protein n=1 Tax=Streptomyces TaxID=1883 RepID=UPI001319C140|nr:hypothetical protein [Streptomyces sp. CNS654]
MRFRDAPADCVGEPSSAHHAVGFGMTIRAATDPKMTVASGFDANPGELQKVSHADGSVRRMQIASRSWNH